MSNLAVVALPGKEGAKVYSPELAVTPKPNSAADPDVAVNGQEGAKGGQGSQDV